MLHIFEISGSVNECHYLYYLMVHVLHTCHLLAVVQHNIIVSTPYRSIAKLFIQDVPSNIGKNELKSILNEEYSFSEFGIPWANHSMEIGFNNFDIEVKRAYKKGMVKTVKFSDLTKEYDDDGNLIK